MRIFHIVARDAWAAAEAVGTYQPESLPTEGFVHFSFAHQVRATWQNYYRAGPNLFVVEVAGLPVEIEGGFPHVYQAIPTSSAVGTYQLDDPIFTASDPGPPDR
jgi:uncharacterized protein (DUF952 family)